MRRPEPFTFFVDRSLGAKVVAGSLRGAVNEDESIEVHDDHFAKDTDDVVWLADAGRRGWVVLTKDDSIRTNELERTALTNAKAATFMLGRQDLSGQQMADAFIEALPRTRRVLRRFHVPFIARITATGAVSILYDRTGRLDRPKRIK